MKRPRYEPRYDGLEWCVYDRVAKSNLPGASYKLYKDCERMCENLNENDE